MFRTFENLDLIFVSDFGFRVSNFLLSLKGFSAFRAPAVRADDTDAIAVTAKLTIGPIVGLGFLLGGDVGGGLRLRIVSGIGAGLVFHRGLAFFIGSDSLRQAVDAGDDQIRGYGVMSLGNVSDCHDCLLLVGSGPDSAATG